MFSVGASPYNSRARQLYGGLAGGDAVGDVYGGWALSLPEGSRGTPAAIRAYYAEHPAQYAADAKWAALAGRYSNSRADRNVAKAIREAVKRTQVKAWKDASEDWRTAYLTSRRSMRPSAFRRRFTPTTKANIWNVVSRMPWGSDASENERMFLSLATRAPYSSAPTVPGMPAAALDGLTTGAYTTELPAEIAELPANYQPVNFLA